MKPTGFILALGAIALAGAAWLYESRLIATERTALAAHQAEVARLHRQLDALRQRQENLTQSITTTASEPASRPAVTPPSPTTDMDRREQADAWRTQVHQLRAMFERQPDQKIPELQLLTELDWLELARQIGPDRDERLARALARDFAVRQFHALLRPAMREHAARGGGVPLTDLAQLAPFFKPAIDPAILERHEIIVDTIVSRRTPNSRAIVARQPIDEDFDSRETVAMNAPGGSYGLWIEYPMNKARDDGISAYAAANNGRISTNPADTTPFVQDPLSRSFLETIAAYNKDHRGSAEPSAILPYATTPEVRLWLERMARARETRRAAGL